MKICWDNLEGFYLTKNGVLKKGAASYIEKEACIRCGEPYLTKKYKPSVFCCRSCAISGEGNMNFGKSRPIGAKEKQAEAMRGKYVGKDHPMYGVHRLGVDSPCWKGGVKKLNIPLYDTYAHQISFAEDVCRDLENPNWLQVKCAYCGKWFTPTITGVQSRIKALNSTVFGEARFYCSENCKQACPIYLKQKWPDGFKHATSREVDPNLRQMVLERDNWTCQICGKTVNEAEIHCHHMDPAAQNPMFQNDMDSCVVLCKGCHGWVHTQYGCRYVDLRCKVI